MILQNLTSNDIFETLINSGASDDEMSEWIIELNNKLPKELKKETIKTMFLELPEDAQTELLLDLMKKKKLLI